MDISYDLWPIWCDYLEEQGQNTELLRYVMTWGINWAIPYNDIVDSIGSPHNYWRYGSSFREEYVLDRDYSGCLFITWYRDLYGDSEYYHWRDSGESQRIR